MGTEEGRFRGALGGFNRQDVASYMEKTAKEHQEQLRKLQEQLDQARSEQEQLGRELEELREQHEALGQQEAQTRESLNQRESALAERERTLAVTRGELQVAQGQLTMAKKQLGDLQAKVAQLEPLAQQYEVLKNRVATVELDAHRKAQETVSRAEAQAAKVRRETAEWVRELSGSYQALREQAAVLTLKAEETSALFENGEQVYQELLRRAGQKEAAP